MESNLREGTTRFEDQVGERTSFSCIAVMRKFIVPVHCIRAFDELP
jgi:hypothetical protein